MKCVNCGFENDDSNLFCNNCGFILEKENTNDKKERDVDLSELEDLLDTAEKKFEEKNTVFSKDEFQENNNKNEDITKEKNTYDTFKENQVNDKVKSVNQKPDENINDTFKDVLKESRKRQSYNFIIPYKENEWGRFIKVFGVIVMIAGFIGSIVLGNAFKIESGYFYKSYEFNWSVFFLGLIFSFIPGIFICGFGELININHKTLWHVQNIEREVMKNDEMH